MLKVTDQFQDKPNVTLHKGENVWLMSSGHYFLVHGIRDKENSHHRYETYRFFASEITSDGSIVVRQDGKAATDKHGHVMTVQADNPDSTTADNKTHFLEQLEAYLNVMVKASENHNMSDSELDGMFVDSDESHYIPEVMTTVRNAQQSQSNQPSLNLF